jgi:nucleoside-diphosphate-sugar epimerase
LSLNKVMVSGATGFVGSAVISQLLTISNICVIAGSRSSESVWPDGVTPLLLPDFLGEGQLIPLEGIDVVVHCAARAHLMSDHASDPLAEFRKINFEGTLNLARQAAAADVRRFIFISSIKVNGESTGLDRSFHPSDLPAPEDAYGISKMEAERALIQLANETGMEVVIIRPPLVYGPGVKGNFASLIRLMAKGLPLPLGAIHNQRSLVGIDNLVDLIIRCIDHPSAANQVFLAGDGEDLSTTELLRSVAEAMGRPARLIPVPAGLLNLGATLLGKRAVAQRLLGSLQVDISKARDLLGWEPPISVEEGLRRCVRDSSV